VVICLERGADCLHMVQLVPQHPQTPSSLASSRLSLLFWYRLTQVLLKKRPLNGCCCCFCCCYNTITDLSLLASTSSTCRSAWSAFAPLCSDQSSAGTVRETVYSRRPGLPSRRTHHLEQSAGQRDLCSISVDLPSASENISVPHLVPRHNHRSPLSHPLTFSGS